MDRRTRIATGACCIVLALLAPTGASAGSQESPEITDPAGDARDVTTLGPAPAADITSVWFETERDDAGTVRALVVHLTTVEPVPEDDGAGFTVSWDARANPNGDGGWCWAQLDWDILPASYGGTTSSMYLSCDDSSSITLEDVLSLDILEEATQHDAGLITDGTHYAVRVDLTALPAEAGVLHEEGDLLSEIYATSRDFDDDAIIGIYGGLCTDVAPAYGCWLGLFASPSSTAHYVIGS